MKGMVFPSSSNTIVRAICPLFSCSSELSMWAKATMERASSAVVGVRDVSWFVKYVAYLPWLLLNGCDNKDSSTANQAWGRRGERKTKKVHYDGCDEVLL